MPIKKDLKRLTRSRMRKTGESYTTARARLLEKEPAATRPEGDYAARAGVSAETVLSKTGRSWEEWVRLLDAVDATGMSHGDIAKHLRSRFEISGWWAQSVTVGYERIRGLRDVGQQRGSGTYESSKSKTIPVPVARLYHAFADDRTRRRWLPGVEWTVRTATPEKSMRITWDDGTSVEVYFLAKGEEKSQVAIQHRKLVSRSDAARSKEFWGARLEALAGILAPAEGRRGPGRRA